MELTPIINLNQLLQTALNCTAAKKKTVEKHFGLSDQYFSNIMSCQIKDEVLVKKILGFLLRCSSAKYGISRKKGIPKGCPHLALWDELTSGIGSYVEYAEIFTFLSHCPTILKPQPMKMPKKGLKNIAYKTKQERHEIVECERQNVQYHRMKARARWLQDTREIRARIRWSLTTDKMRSIYINERKESKTTIEKLCIKSNTSKYAIEALENGSVFDTYTAAKLLFFILTNQNIDDSEYKHHPIDVFVDYLAGWEFRFQNYMPPEFKSIENPKACNLQLYLKK